MKENEDGVFVKVNDERVKSKKGHLMEQVLDVKDCPTKGRENYVVVSFFMLNISVICHVLALL